MYAETELKEGEKVRLLPFATDSSSIRNNILRKVIYKYVDLPTANILSETEVGNDEIDLGDIAEDDDDEIRDAEEYEHGITADDHDRLIGI